MLKPVSEEQQANAAVALLLKLKDDDLEVLFVKRAENAKDPWSGQIALPGGKHDPKDANLKETVTRETFEETGINLAENSFLGVLCAIQSEPRRDIRILPFVNPLEHEPTIKLSIYELEAFIWVPLKKIAASKGMVEFSFGRVPAYVLEKTVVWGITYRILTDFLHTIQRA